MTIRATLEKFRDEGIGEQIPRASDSNPFPDLASLESYWVERMKAADAKVRNIASAALRRDGETGGNNEKP